MSGPSLLPIVLKEAGVCFFYVICHHAYWCPTRFPHHMLFVSHNSTMTGTTSGEGTVHPSGEPDFTQFSLYCFVDHCLSFCPVSTGHCILPQVITPLVFSNFFCVERSTVTYFDQVASQQNKPFLNKLFHVKVHLQTKYPYIYIYMSQRFHKSLTDKKIMQIIAYHE